MLQLSTKSDSSPNWRTICYQCTKLLNVAKTNYEEMMITARRFVDSQQKVLKLLKLSRERHKTPTSSPDEQRFDLEKLLNLVNSRKYSWSIDY